VERSYHVIIIGIVEEKEYGIQTTDFESPRSTSTDVEQPRNFVGERRRNRQRDRKRKRKGKDVKNRRAEERLNGAEESR